MLVEIPDTEVILSVILAFVVGLGALYVFYKVLPLVKPKSELPDITQSERLEYYERQLIDIKIRMDAMEIQGVEEKSDNDPNLELKQFLQKLVKNEAVEPQPEKAVEQPRTTPEKIDPVPDAPRMEHVNPTIHVLQLITDKTMTSRDIQVTLNRSREHTSRLMKKLFEDGLVERNIETKPYTYSITEKGRTKIDELQPSPITV